MSRPLVTLGNWAHQKPTPMRRATIVLVVVGLALGDALFWLCMPFIATLFPIAAGVVEMCKAFAKVPSLTANQARADVERWRDDMPGIRRIWRARKENPNG